MSDQPVSIKGVCNTGVLAGAESDPEAAPNLLIEVPHGATRLLHYESLRGLLRGSYDENLTKFFHVNTDVGAPEVAVAVARGLLARNPEMKIRILRCLVPRTFIDCNRMPKANGDGASNVTPQVPHYVTDPADIATVTAYHQNYVTQAGRAYAEVCGSGGYGLILHTYAPRSVRLDRLDGDVVEQLAEAWLPKNRRKWAKRPDVDLITAPPEGESLAPAHLVEDVREHYGSINVEVGENRTYRLHPQTLGLHWSQKYAKQVLCVELNRQRLVKKWTPLEPLEVTPRRVSKMAGPLVDAMVGLFETVPA
jgi:hypothetical protein